MFIHYPWFSNVILPSIEGVSLSNPTLQSSSWNNSLGLEIRNFTYTKDFFSYKSVSCLSSEKAFCPFMGGIILYLWEQLVWEPQGPRHFLSLATNALDAHVTLGNHCKRNKQS